MKSLTNHCIVLDLDETLVHTYDDLSSLKQLKIFSDPNLIDLRRRSYHLVIDDAGKRGVGEKTELWGILRPHVKEFLSFCFKYFKLVIVWSAGQTKYVEAIVKILFRDLEMPHLVYSSPHCVALSTDIRVKPLLKIIDNEPGFNKYMSLTNTFILDNTRSVFAHCNPSNGILIPDYDPSTTIEGLRSDELRLKQLIAWLLKREVMTAKDIRLLDKSRIFS